MMESLEFDLQQAELSGNNLIEAGAGTGKTYSIEGIYLRLLLQSTLVGEETSGERKPLQVKNILVVTYTEAATAELRERIVTKMRLALRGFQLARSLAEEYGDSIVIETIQERLGILHDDFLESLIRSYFIANPMSSALARLDSAVTELTLAVYSFDEAAIYTIHAFCNRMLSDFFLESQAGFSFEFVTDQTVMIEDCVNDFWRNEVYGVDESAYAVFFLNCFPTPLEIQAYFARITAKPEVILLPQSIQNGKEWFRKIAEWFTKLKNRWAEDNTTIRQLFEQFAPNFQPTFTKAFPKYYNEIECFLQGDDPLSSRECLEKFTPAYIAKKTRAQKKQKLESPFHPIFAEFESYLHATAFAKERLIAWMIPQLQKALRIRKEEQRLLSFDDLLFNLRKALLGASGKELAVQIRQRYQAALIDEFQDTDPVQYDIFREIFLGHRPLFFIGDPKQSIYNFRGADIFAYFKAAQEMERKSHLSTNWRSDADLVQAINTIFASEKDDQFVFAEHIGFTCAKASPTKPQRSLVIRGENPAPFQLWFLDKAEPVKTGEAREQIFEASVDEIVRILNLAQKGEAGFATHPNQDGKMSEALIPVYPKDIAILVRSHMEAERFQRQLRIRGVPSVIRTQKNIFLTKEFAEIQTLLPAIADYRNESLLKAALLTDIFGYSVGELFALLQDEKAWEIKFAEFRNYHEFWHHKGFYSMMRFFMKKERIRERFLEQEGGERKLTNFLQLLEILNKVDTETQMGMRGLLHWMRQAKETSSELEENQIRLETDEAALKILTIHSSKGLEFPIVFCPFAWTIGVNRDIGYFFHDPLSNEALTWDLTNDPLHRERYKQEKLAEQVRLAYVAFTRAKHCCYVMWGNINKTGESCFQYLFHRKPGSFTKDEGTEKNNLWEDLHDLQQRSGGTIDLQKFPVSTGEVFASLPDNGEELQYSLFEKKPTRKWGVYSFTGLTSQTGQYAENPDRDEEITTPPTPLELEENLAAHTMFTFPGGIKTGNFFHEVLEETRFHEDSTEELSQLVDAKLQRYRFDVALKPVTLKLVEEVRTLPLFSPYAKRHAFSFRDIPQDQILKEMEFFFPVRHAEINKMRELVARYAHIPANASLLQTLQELDFKELKGFLKGFVDMIFHYEGRFYLLDWKTNKFGSHLENYLPDKLKQQIEAHQFNLQYFLYTVALHKYLKTRVPNYDFAQHFGGVYYLFLRGIQKDSNEYGVYYESLAESKELIEQLDAFFEGN